MQRYEYDAYGKPTLWAGDYDHVMDEPSMYGNPYFFTGRRVDVLDNGAWMIQYNRNRFYDYHTGRWHNQDPIGYQDSINLYAYVGSNPINRFDSYGLFICFYDCPKEPDLNPQSEGVGGSELDCGIEIRQTPFCPFKDPGHTWLSWLGEDPYGPELFETADSPSGYIEANQCQQNLKYIEYIWETVVVTEGYMRFEWNPMPDYSSP